MYPTARLIFVALAGAPLVLAAAVLRPSLWILGAAWILFSTGLFWLDSFLAAASSVTGVSLEIAPILSVGRPAKATIKILFSKQSPSKVQLAIDPERKLRVEPGRQECVVDHSRAIAAITLTPMRRGESTIETIWTRWRGPLGLVWRQRRFAERRKVAVVTDISGVKEQAQVLFSRGTQSSGLRAQLRTGQGSEFNALKEFQSGMDRRTIDWKQSARHSKVLAREFQAEENLHIVFAIDTGRLMSEPLDGLPRIDRAIQAFLLLAFVALRLGDRVEVFAFDERPRLSSGSMGGANAFATLQRLAARLDYSTSETNFTLGLTQLSAQTMHRSIVVVFTDFSDTTSAELMVENLKHLLRRHAVLFVVFRDEELESMRRARPDRASDVSRAVLADAMLRERETVTARLRRLGVDVVEAPLERIGMRLIQAYLSLKQGHSGA